MTAAQDNAYTFAAAADALTAQANTLQTSQLHFMAQQAHIQAAAAWIAAGVPQKATLSTVQAAIHATCAPQLKTAGK